MLRPAIAALTLTVFVSNAADAAADAKRGEAVFGRCAQCHSTEKDGGNGLGPNLYGVAGRKAAALPDFYYSPALKNARITWSDDKLRAWVTNPQKLVPGTRMIFAGMKNPQEIDDLLAYLHRKR